MAEEVFEITITGNEATYDLRADGAINGTYIGQFKFRCFLTPIQKIAANREMRQLLGDQMIMAPQHESNLAFAITQLKYRIVSAPPFWSSGEVAGDIPDSDIIMKVLNAAIEAEVQYLKQLKKRKDDSLNRAKAAAEAMLNNIGEDEGFDDEDETETSGN